MHVLLLVVVVLAGDVVLGGRAIARGCATCGMGPGTRRCIPNGGILVFNSVRPNVPAYWTLFADARGVDSLRRLDGELAVFSDAEAPGVPGFPGTFEDPVFVGERATFAGFVRRGRLRGRATWPDGSTCDYRLTIAFGLGGTRPNRFVCRDGTGTTTAAGPVDVQGIRLRGCRRGG
jgi:hypothetical protein